MKPTAKRHESGQSLWLDNISREMLDSGQGEYALIDLHDLSVQPRTLAGQASL